MQLEKRQREVGVHFQGDLKIGTSIEKGRKTKEEKEPH